MTIEQFYAVTGGDYATTKTRFMTDDRIMRFVGKFPADGSFKLLVQSLQEGNVQEAFRAAHTLKGVAQNLGFNALYKEAEAVTEVLRGGSLEVSALMPNLEKIYKDVIDGIANLS